MAFQTFTIESELGPAEAFDLVVDLTNVSAWDEGVTDPHLIGGDSGTVGARYEVTVTGFDGNPTTAVYELTEVDAPNAFTMVGRHPDFQADDTIRFAPTASGCEVTYEAGLVLLGENPPLSDEQLDRVFAKIAAVPQAGLQRFLNP